MADAEDQVPAKSADEEAKPAEVPDSDPTDLDTDKLPKLEENIDEKLNGDKMENADDHGEHVVDGDEDEVIY